MQRRAARLRLRPDHSLIGTDGTLVYDGRPVSYLTNMKIRLVLAFVLAAVVTSLACNDKPPMVPDQDQTADASAE